MIPTMTLPKLTPRALFIPIVYAVALMFWMSLEDNGAASVTVLGTIGAILLVIWQTLTRLGGRTLSARGQTALWLILPTLMGALASPVTVFLMFLKNSWHAHAFPDYPTPMMGALLARLPIWMLAGLCIGIAIVLLRIAATPPSEIVGQDE